MYHWINGNESALRCNGRRRARCSECCCMRRMIWSFGLPGKCIACSDELGKIGPSQGSKIDRIELHAHRPPPFDCHIAPVLTLPQPSTSPTPTKWAVAAKSRKSRLVFEHHSWRRGADLRRNIATQSTSGLQLVDGTHNLRIGGETQQ